MAEQFGYHTGDALESILADQEAKRRQTLIDTISAANVQSQISDRDENAATNQEYRRGLIADRKFKEGQATDEKNRLANTSGYYWDHAYDDPDPVIQNARVAIANDPKRAEQMEQVILNRQLILEAQKAKEKPLVPSRIVHYGKNVAEDVMAPAAFPFVGNQPVMVPQGDARELIHEAQPSQPSAANAAQLYQEDVPNDPKDPSKGTTRMSFWLKPGEMPSERNRVNGGILHKDRNEPQGKLDPNTLYGGKEYQQYQAALKGSGANAAASRSSARANFIRSIKDPLVIADLTAILQDKVGRAKPFEQLVQEGKLTGDESHLYKMKTILDAIPLNNRD
jgi:hypothetical protein